MAARRRHGDIEVLDLQGRLEQWRHQQHPKRNYVGSQLVEASGALPRSQQEQIAGGHVYSPARRAAGGTASGVPGAASGAPPSEPIELDASHFLDNQAGARGEEVPNPVGAFGGSSSLPAPQRPAFLVSLSDEEDSDDSTRPGSSTSTSSESECEYSGDDEVLPEEEEEEHAGAASGALRGVKQQQSELDAKSAEEKKDNKVVLARATRRAIQQRQVHFRDEKVLWPEESYMWLEEAARVDERRECLRRLLSVLGRECATFPSEEGILKGIPHMNRKRQNEPFEVAHAFSTHKLHYQPVLTERLKDVRFEDMTCAFCRAWPNLHPVVSGGDQVVQHVNHAHPVWDVLRQTMGVRTVPDFLKHLFTKHDGEARLIGGTSSSWTPMTTHVCNPKFWSYQFASTPETRKWLYRKNPKNKLINWLSIDEVHEVLDQGEGQTLLIRRVRAASGAALFEVRTGRVATLAQVMFHGLNEGCTCYDVYKFYMALPIVIHKRHHPQTGVPSRARKTITKATQAAKLNENSKEQAEIEHGGAVAQPPETKRSRSSSIWRDLEMIEAGKDVDNKRERRRGNFPSAPWASKRKERSGSASRSRWTPRDANVWNACGQKKRRR